MHTPGPWAVRVRDCGDNIFTTSNPPRRIANTFGDTENIENMANAKLIAAAPEMLAALEFVAKWIDFREIKGESIPIQLTDAVKWAIAKARLTN